MTIKSFFTNSGIRDCLAGTRKAHRKPWRNAAIIKWKTVSTFKKNEKARKPSLVVEVDFGKEIGVKTSSAQITHFYNQENLVGKQVIGVCNFPEKNITGVKSQFLLLGSIDSEGKVTLVHPSQKAENGLPIA